VGGVDQDHACNLLGISVSIQPPVEAAVRITHQHVRTFDAGGVAEKGMQVARDLLGVAGFRPRLAPA
jgi:hypothetical protein